MPIIYSNNIRSGPPLSRSVTFGVRGDSFDIPMTEFGRPNTTALASCVDLDLSAAPLLQEQVHNLWSSQSLVFTRTTATITFRRYGLVDLPTEQVLQVSFRTTCFVRRIAPDASYQMIVLRPGREPETLPPNATSPPPDIAAAAEQERIQEIVDMGRDGAIVASMGSYFLAAASGSPSIALQASRSMTPMAVATCAGSLDGEPLPLSESLFPAAVGKSRVRYYIGALVTNSMLMLFFFGIHAVAVFGFMITRMVSHVSGRFVFPPFKPVFAKAHFPSLLYPVYCAGTAAAIKHGFVVAFAGEVITEQVGATFLSLPWFLILPAVGFTTLSRSFTPTFQLYVPTKNLFTNLLRPVGMWRNGLNSVDESYVGMYRRVFDGFVGGCVGFASEELFLSLLLGASEGFAVGFGDWGVCVTVGLLNALLLLMHLIALGRFVPMAVRGSTVTHIFLTLLQMVANFLAAVRAGIAGSEGKASTNFFRGVVALVLTAQVLTLLFALASLVSEVFEYVMQRRNPRPLKPFADPDADDDDVGGHEMDAMAGGLRSGGGGAGDGEMPLLRGGFATAGRGGAGDLSPSDYSTAELSDEQRGRAPMPAARAAPAQRGSAAVPPWLARQTFGGGGGGYAAASSGPAYGGMWADSDEDEASGFLQRLPPTSAYYPATASSPTVADGGPLPGSPSPRNPLHGGGGDTATSGRGGAAPAARGTVDNSRIDPDVRRPRSESPPVDPRAAAAGGAQMRYGASATLFAEGPGGITPYSLTEGPTVLNASNTRGAMGLQPPTAAPWDGPSGAARAGDPREFAARQGHADVFNRNAGDDFDRRHGVSRAPPYAAPPAGGASLAANWHVPDEKRLAAEL